MLVNKRSVLTTPPKIKWRYLATAVVLTSAMFVDIGAATATTSTPKRSLLQAGLAYYQGKTVQFIVTSSAGSPTDTQDRALSQAMGTYLHATINPLNITTGGTIGGQDILAHSAPNGLTIGSYSLNTEYYDLITHGPVTNFNQEHEVFLGGIPNSDSVIVTQSNSNISSFATLFNATSANPTKVLVNLGLGALAFQLLGRSLGLHLDFIPYASTSLITAGFVRGDGPVSAINLGSIQPEITAGEARIIATTRLTDPTPTNDLAYPAVHSVPDVPQLLKQHPPTTPVEKRAAKFLLGLGGVLTNVFGVSTKTPPDVVAALTAALKAALKDPTVRSTYATSANQSTKYITPATIKSEYAAALRFVPDIASSLGY